MEWWAFGAAVVLGLSVVGSARYTSAAYVVIEGSDGRR
jgi:hypothetical protein